MKNSNVISLETKKNLRCFLDEEVRSSELSVPSSLFPNFASILADERNCINWEKEESHPAYDGHKMIGTTITRIAPYSIPSLPNVVPELKEYKVKLEASLAPLSKTRQNPKHLELFKQSILLLINCYPTYCRKDDDFKQDTIISFLTFFEKFPINIITKTIHEWIESEKEFPLVVDLKQKMEAKVENIENKINRVEKIILESSAY